MKKQTTTQQFTKAITNNLLHITKAEICNKSTRQTNIISPDTFKESLEFLGETLFADAIGWHYERNAETNGYIAETGRMNSDTEIIITVYLDVCNGACKENVEKELEVTEE